MGAGLTPNMVLRAYTLGVFPMGVPGGGVQWFTADPRCIIELDGLRISRSLRKIIHRGVFEIRVNSDFDAVIAGCAARPVHQRWITPAIMRIYRALHRAGYAHSVEAWRDGRLAGGLYGVALGGAFFGESMFHRVSDASKVALAALVRRMIERGFVLLDSQWMTPHLQRLGAIEIPAEEYLRRLNEALQRRCTFAD
jgi:leucyl/phenylalanyl-tRNA--protein transferase